MRSTPTIAVLFAAATLWAGTSSAAATGEVDAPVIEDKTYGSTTPSAPPLVDTSAPAPSKPTEAPSPNGATVAPPSAESWSAAKIAEKPDPGFRTLRVGAELAAASVGGGVLAIAGGLVGCAIDRSSGDTACLGGAALGVALGEFTGVLLGTVLTGYGMEGNGSILATTGGLLIGATVGATGGILMALAASSGNNPIAIGAGVITVLVAPVLGAVLGYELTSDTHRPKKPIASAVTPFLAPTARGSGALAGISGAF